MGGFSLRGHWAWRVKEFSKHIKQVFRARQASSKQEVRRGGEGGEHGGGAGSLRQNSGAGGGVTTGPNIYPQRDKDQECLSWAEAWLREGWMEAGRRGGAPRAAPHTPLPSAAPPVSPSWFQRVFSATP